MFKIFIYPMVEATDSSIPTEATEETKTSIITTTNSSGTTPFDMDSLNFSKLLQKLQPEETARLKESAI